MLFFFALIIFQQAKKSENYDAWVVHSYEVLSIANQIDNNAYKIESAYRGYLLTGAEEFLIPVSQINQNVLLDFNSLENLIRDSQDQEIALAHIRKTYFNFITLQDAYQKVYQQRGASGLVIGDIKTGQQIMNDLQSDLSDFVTVELGNLNRRIALEQSENSSHTMTIFVGATISILVLIIANALILILMSTQNKTKQRLQNIEELYKVVLENMSDGLFDYDTEHDVMNFSASYKRQLGYEENELPPEKIENLLELVHPDDRDRVTSEHQAFVKQETPAYSVAFRMKRKNDSWIWVLSRAMGTWDKNGRLVRLFGIHTDITEQKQHEEKLRELNSELEDFTYIASHDLRSPLVNIKGFTKEIESSVHQLREIYENKDDQATKNKNLLYIVEKDIPESLSFINSAVERMDTLTNAILNLSRIGRRIYKPTKINTDEIVKRCLNTLKYEMSAANTKTTVEPLPEITADALAMEQIFSNLIENAVKYLNPERPGQINITGFRQEKNVVYAIQDNGRGISEKEGDRIFSIFRRAHNNPNIRGAGMGLAFVKATIRKMGGTIRYESVLGQGTTFYVTLPDQQNGEKNAIA
jgi:PAS domain S-box-containing protein